uniref:Putative secreted protein n=1 Tax=Ixodes ricinus TaxID=34613 RepID=A0A6B0U6H0_IXORI
MSVFYAFRICTGVRSWVAKSRSTKLIFALLYLIFFCEAKNVLQHSICIGRELQQYCKFKESRIFENASTVFGRDGIF